MVEYIVRNTEMLKNTIVVHRGHFGGYLLIHQGAVGRNIWGTGTAGPLGCSLRTSGWNGRSSSPDATSSSQPSRRHGPLALPLSVPSHHHTLRQPRGWAQGLCHEDCSCAVNAAWTILCHLSSSSPATMVGRPTGTGTNVRQENCIYKNGSVSKDKLGQRKTASRKNSRVQWHRCRNITSTASTRSTFTNHLLCARHSGVESYTRHSPGIRGEIRTT